MGASPLGSTKGEAVGSEASVVGSLVAAREELILLAISLGTPPGTAGGSAEAPTGRCAGLAAFGHQSSGDRLRRRGAGAKGPGIGLDRPAGGRTPRPSILHARPEFRAWQADLLATSSA